MNKKERLEQYGITSKDQIYGMIERVDSIFPCSNNGFKINCEKTIAHESHYGNIKDRTKKSGEGLVQIDPKTFDWIKNRLLLNKKYDIFIEDIHKYCGIRLINFEYHHLRHNPEMAIIFYRLRFKFTHKLFPIDDNSQWELYKMFWNGKGENGGAATREKWDRDTKDCFFKVGD